MRTIKVSSLPLTEVIADIANSLGAKLNEQCDEYKMDVPAELGIGYIQGLDFDGGIGLIQYDCILNEELNIEFVENDVHPLKFLYCSKGSIIHKFENDTREHEFGQYEGVIVASPRGNGHIINFPKDTHIMMTSIELNRTELLERYFCDIELIHRKLKNLFLDTNAIKSFYHHCEFSLQLSGLIELMSKYKRGGFVRRLFLESKAYEILSIQMLMFEDDILDINKRTVLRRSEIESIKEAADIIDNLAEDIDTIETLSKRVGMNSHKLQEGFQHLYHKSVNKFIQSNRLEKAKALLVETNLTISHICEMVGWSSTSHFTKLFKERVGVTPGQYRNMHFRSLTQKPSQN